mmetsp:Transcript_40612/g.45381  ORF Transcript_40612/g.45381 Transcript_40612/m.45381 type:complete len:140 (-) Transcript_40612:897-1316(-)
MSFNINTPQAGTNIRPLIQVPGPLPSNHPSKGSASSERAYVDIIAVRLYKLVRCQTQTSQQSHNLQVQAAKGKIMKDSAMLAQTKDMIRTTRVLLLSMESYQGAHITANNLPFLEAMLNLTERPSVQYCKPSPPAHTQL